MMNELTHYLYDIDIRLGFASAEIAWAYIGCFLASLLCVIYGLITWNRDGKITRMRSRRVNKGKRPRRRR